ncbi:unnamed protein product, partial [Effrenium voratum]
SRGVMENEMRQVEHGEELGDLFKKSALQRSELEEDTNLWGLRSLQYLCHDPENFGGAGMEVLPPEKATKRKGKAGKTAKATGPLAAGDTAAAPG